MKVGFTADLFLFRVLIFSVTIREYSKDLDGNIVTTGTFSVPNDYDVTLTDLSALKLYSFYSGTVKIDEITETKVSGTFTGNAYCTDLNTNITNSTKVLTLTAKFSL